MNIMVTASAQIRLGHRFQTQLRGKSKPIIKLPTDYTPHQYSSSLKLILGFSLNNLEISLR